MRLTVVGSGHVGLVAGLCFAEIGHDVVCLDSIEEKVNGLAEGRLPFYEPELQGLLERNREAGAHSLHDRFADSRAARRGVVSRRRNTSAAGRRGGSVRGRACVPRNRRARRRGQTRCRKEHGPCGNRRAHRANSGAFRPQGGWV